MAVITMAELDDLLSIRKSAQIVTFTAITVPEVNKFIKDELVVKGKSPNPYYGRLLKHARVNGMINWVYANSVNNQRAREGLEPDFVPEPRKWGQRIPKSPYVIHTPKGSTERKFYLELKGEKVLFVNWLCDGKPIEYDTVKPYLPARKEEGARQGVEKKIYLRDYELCNIKSITIGGEDYHLNHDETYSLATEG